MLAKLIEKKRVWGHLEGSDAAEYLRYLRATGSESSTKWTDETFAELTKWQLGMKTRSGFNFEVIAPRPEHSENG